MILPIYTYGKSVLSKKGEALKKDHPNLNALIDDMFQTMKQAGGIGLAAQQIGLPLKLFVIDLVDYTNADESLKDFKKIFINSEVIELSEDIIEHEEGCLSYPGIHIPIKRSARVKLNNDLFFTFGPSVAHSSNGNFSQPNNGINLVTANAGLTWKIREATNINLINLPPNIQYKKNRYFFLFSGGIRQISRYFPERYFTSTTLAEYSRRISRTLAFGGGLDFFYDPTEGRETFINGPNVENLVPWHAGMHLSCEIIWGDLSFILQPGYKIITPSAQSFYSFNRIGLRYYLDKNFVLNFSLKSHKFAADYFELGIGYMF